MAIEMELVDRVLHLPDQERAELARQIILSLETADPDADADAAWEAEIERRAGEVDRGEVALVDWRDAIERARRSLRRNGSR
jgi:putative addiction module component (TIGR02574 family)